MAQTGTRTQEVVICESCKGAGKIYDRTSMYDSEWIDCSTCRGKGRLKKIISVTYEQL